MIQVVRATASVVDVGVVGGRVVDFECCGAEEREEVGDGAHDVAAVEVALAVRGVFVAADDCVGVAGVEVWWEG